MPNRKNTPRRPGVRAHDPGAALPAGAFVPAQVAGDAPPPGATAHPAPSSPAPAAASPSPAPAPAADPVVSFAPPGAPATSPAAPPAVVPPPAPAATGAASLSGATSSEAVPGGGPDVEGAHPVHISDVLAALGVERAVGSALIRREPSPYDPESTEGRDRSFFVDVRAAAMGDGEARGRVDQFRRQLGAYITAAMDQAGSSDVIPPAWGGQWYVEEIEQLRPLVASFSSVTISDSRPIPIPVFASTTPAQIVTEHTEGQPPQEGEVNFDTVVMPPKGYSGKAKVTRELLDSSPQLVDRSVSLALRESYSQVTEAAFAAVINAGALAGVAAADGTAVALERAIRATIARYPRQRFSLCGRVMLSSNHFEALAGADADDGRPLMPYVGYGPTNAAGTAAAAYGSLQVAGVEAVGSWANVPGRTYLRGPSTDALSFESSLLDFRFYEKSGPELVEFAVFGYFGGVVRQPRGVRYVQSAAAPLAAEGDEAEPAAAPGNARAKAEK